jgi:hypothetical protein
MMINGLSVQTGPRLARFIVFLLTATLGSCNRPRSAPEYSFGYYNDTGVEITDVRLSWLANQVTHQDGAGVLGTGGSGAASHEQPRPIPEKATVAWKTADGTGHSKDVAVVEAVVDPSNFSGTIFFKFTAAGDVKVVPITYAQRDQLAAQGKPAIP